MKFKCIHTGQIYEFVAEVDIKSMKEHKEYVVVEEKPVEKTKPKVKEA